MAKPEKLDSTIRVVTPPPNDDFNRSIVLNGTNLTACAYDSGQPYSNELATRQPGCVLS